MSKTARLKLISQIERARKSLLISYVTSARQNLEVPMAMDAVRRIYEHMPQPGAKGKVPRIDLLLHSNGGDGIVPWRLVTLIRERAEEFNVLVPYKAFSAATLTALGANKIVMHPMGMLGPTDPTVTNQFNPPDPANPARRLGISVEDVTAYISLIKEDAGIQHEDQLVQAFNKLADNVHPLALGNVKRSLSQSRMMARKLLALHMDRKTEEHHIDEIVDNFTSKLFYHGHPINRLEAREELGLRTIEFPPASVEKPMWELYLEYEKEIRAEERFDPASEFLFAFPDLKPGGPKTSPATTAKLVFIESKERTDLYILEYELCGEKGPDGTTKVTMITRRQGWTVE
jgi:hypothetical protein